MAAAATPAPKAEVPEVTRAVETEESAEKESTEKTTAVEAIEGRILATEVDVEASAVDLDALLVAALDNLAYNKDDTKAVRARVRQVARQRRHKRRREFAQAFSETAPGVAAYGLVGAGFTAFAVALVFFATGNVTAGLTLSTVAAAAWGLAAVMLRK